MSSTSPPHPPLPITTNNAQPLQIYKLIRTIGEGAFAKVKLVRHLPSNELVVMKEISKTSLSTDSNYQRFIQEITFFKKLSHPNIISLYEVIESPSHYYFVIKYADNSDLLTHITEQRYLKESTAKDIFTQVVKGLMYLHKEHVVHRDLKPENILLMNNYNTAIISDFGLAKCCEGKESKLHTVCGSLHYASPEIIMGEAYDGERSDVWSLGVLLFVMVTGQLPFNGDNSDEVCNNIVNVCFRFPLDVKVSAECKDLIYKMLVHDPQQRIKLHEVMVHPFISEGKGRCGSRDACCGGSRNEDKVITETINALNAFGIETTKEDIISKMKRNVFDQVTTCYKLMKQKHKKQMYNGDNNKDIVCVSYRPEVKCKLLSPRNDIAHHNGVFKLHDKSKRNCANAKQNSKTYNKQSVSKTKTSSTFQSKTNIRIVNQTSTNNYRDNPRINKIIKTKPTTPHHHSSEKHQTKDPHHPLRTTINLSDTNHIKTIFKHLSKNKTTIKKARQTTFTSSFADMNINNSKPTASPKANTILHLYTSNNPKQKLPHQHQSTSNTFNSHHEAHSTSTKKTKHSLSLNKTKQHHTPRKCLITFSNSKPLSTAKPTPHKQQHHSHQTTPNNIFMICTTKLTIAAIKRKLSLIARTREYTLRQSTHNVYQLSSKANDVLDIHVNISGILKLCHSKGEKVKTKEMVQVILHEIGFD